MEIEVNMGQWVVSNSGASLTASGVGSCLVVTFFDSKAKLGAMAHAMLPADTRHCEEVSKATDRHCEPPKAAKQSQPNDQHGYSRYVNEAIDEALNKMASLGSKRQDLEAKLVGGANMFPGSKPEIGVENIAVARKILKDRGIKLVGESVGGSIGRSVELSVSSGVVTVKVVF